MTGRAEKVRARPYKSHTGDGDECVHGLQKNTARGRYNVPTTICEIFFLLFMGELRTIGLY